MDACDVLIVGGGPAGSSCAWALRGRGLDVLIVDRATFPREKLCGGWVTPLVFEELEIDPRQYSVGRTLQPITSFRIGSIGSMGVSVDCGRIVSYGVRRCEFDEFLLHRSGARTREGYAVAHVERDGSQWIVNSEIRARMLVGAGGHFCPIPKLTGDVAKHQAVVAREVEFEMSASEAERCTAIGQAPELYFCRDMRGYGWCFRKGRYLNIGLGRLDPHRLGEHVDHFVSFLRSTRRLEFDDKLRFAGHAYFLYGGSHRKVFDDALLLIGDSAGLAYAQSGEGIRPAVESGLIGAHAILAAEGDYSRVSLARYAEMLEARFGRTQSVVEKIAKFTPDTLRNVAARALLRTPAFARLVVEEWFLRAGEARVAAISQGTAATRSVA